MTTQINPENIVKVYSGRAGCGCGCKGSYFEDAKNIARVVKTMNSRANEIRETVPGIFSVENETRFYWAYTS